jgi:hypothetical protein
MIVNAKRLPRGKSNATTTPLPRRLEISAPDADGGIYARGLVEKAKAGKVWDESPEICRIPDFNPV